MPSVLSRCFRFLQTGPIPKSSASPMTSAAAAGGAAPPPSTKPQTKPQAKKAARQAEHNPLVDLPLADFLASEKRTAWTRLLANVQPEGASPGCVVASPSKALPDYWYEWTRDSAIVERNVVHRYIREGRPEDRKTLEEYIEASRIMQHKETVIGGFSNGGLGEVKYHVNHEPFTGDWGRPQADGPGSRIITIGTLAIHLLEQGGAEGREYVKKAIYPGTADVDGVERTGVMKGDLEYVATHWQMKGFDLWEEVSGVHFYTLLTLRSALYLGARLAALLDDPSAVARYTAAAEDITPVLTRFWDAERGILRVTVDHGKEEGAVGGWAGTADGEDKGKKKPEKKAPNGAAVEEDEERELASHENETHGKDSELDVAVVLAVLHAGRTTSWAKLTSSSSLPAAALPAESADKILSTLARLVDEFAKVYPLNAGRREKGAAVALGRYPEDVYDGVGVSKAHPWYLATAGAAEYLFLLISDLGSLTSSGTASTVHLTPTLHSALASFLPTLSPPLPPVNSTLDATSPAFAPLVRALFALADSFLSVVQEYVGVDGQLSEQFERSGKPKGSEEHEGGVLEDSKKDQETGEEVEAIGRGARDLTWSYAAFITAVEERERAEKVVEALEGKGKGKQVA
ncbi:hypothetical protein JCM10213_001189 [Rhodosporidiobolus nylandii]